MDKRERNVKAAAPMLFPIEPEQFWQMLRVLVREEVSQLERQPVRAPAYDTPARDDRTGRS
ncbi:hypothetical protein ACTJJB_26090 [Chitinophaga sp. 22536]|uniref:hypothetical protein n=1 Tax=unclassified Chitinophaga TaxID=2619133 RepID=UPI003F86AFB1